MKNALNNKKRIHINYKGIIHVFFPLFAGALIYLFLRDDASIISNLSNYKISINLNLWLDSFIKYSLADGLWLYSFLWTISLLNQNNKKLVIALTILATSAAIASEICQKYSFIKGTFDYHDIATYLAAYSLFHLSFYFNIDLK